MLDPVYFEDRLIVIKDASKAVLSDSEFGKWSAGQRLKKVFRISPL